MHRKLIKSAIVLTLLFSGLFVSGQILDPVDWKFSEEKTGKDEYTLIFTADIENKWHLYSQNLPEGGPIPTSFSFESAENYQLLGKVEEVSEAEVKYDPSFEMNLTMFSTQAVFQQKIKLLTSGDFTLTGSLEYMCCDDERCLPPTEEEFSFFLDGSTEVAGKAAGIQKAETNLGKGIVGSETEEINTGSLESLEKATPLSAKGVGKRLTMGVFPDCFCSWTCRHSYSLCISNDPHDRKLLYAGE
ncbi:protein-disulfide reductase DsbD domain-containing protein [Bacteroidota bacterium]